MSDAAPATQTPTATVSIPLPAAVAGAEAGLRLWRQFTPTETLILILVMMIGLMIGGLYWSVSYAVNTAIPKHLDSIQAGYKEIQQEDLKAREELEKRHDERIKHFGEKWDGVVRELRDAAKIQSDLVREFLLNRRAAAGLPIGPGET